MRKAYWVFFALVLMFAGSAVETHASALRVGADFDLQKLAGGDKKEGNTIVAFVPSLTYDCEYASMLTQSFYHYFDRNLAFYAQEKYPQTNIFLIVGDAKNEAKSTQNILGKMTVIYDQDRELYKHFGVELPYSKNANSTVLLLDKDEKVVHLDAFYRAQGEHLKPLENKLKELNGINTTLVPESAKKLKIGDKAPDFLIKDGQKLSDMRGEVVLVSFYPAAFSGTFPKPYVPEPVHTETGKVGEKYSIEIVKPGALTTLDERALMSCSAQIFFIDEKSSKMGKTAKRVLVSSSTPTLLYEWAQALGTSNIIYANDPDYSVSRQYFSYNTAGYNNRVSVIVDKKGKIAFIDESFEAADEAVIEKKIGELLKK